MIPQWIIEKKRDGGVLCEDEIRDFIRGYGESEIPDYQMAALAMAVYFKGMTFEEVTVLTDAMMRSGDVLDTSGIAAPKSDKHSTGGIGDKVSLILGPLAASCGVAVPMISGRGLGITGGTLDKFESIPGYRTDLDTREFLDVVAACGCSIIGQTANLAPVDKRLYALRDVTATVPSIPLISASIMSKKLAESTDSLVLDVKWGSGAFMQTLTDARKLADTMTEIGSRMGRRMTALLTDMNQPLGRTAGNAVEVTEAIEALKGNGCDDLMVVTTELTAHMVLLSDRATDLNQARLRVLEQIESGAALEKFREMVRLHGGDDSAIDQPEKLPGASLKKDYPSPAAGWVARADAGGIGRAVLMLGAGRQKVTDTVDHGVGATGIAKVGEQVEAGQPLLTLHANDAGRLAEAEALLTDAFVIKPEMPGRPPPIVDTIVGEPRGEPDLGRHSV